MDKMLKLWSPGSEISLCSINRRFRAQWNTRIKIKCQRKKRIDLAWGCHTQNHEQLIKNKIRRTTKDVQRFISVCNTTSLPAAGSRSPRGWWMLLLIRWAADSSDPETKRDIPLESPWLAVIITAAKWRKALQRARARVRTRTHARPHTQSHEMATCTAYANRTSSEV
jgi:hypothetical protein